MRIFKPKQKKAPWYRAKHGDAQAKMSFKAVAREMYGKQRRKRVSAMSDRRKLDNVVYRKAKAEYMVSHPVCEHCKNEAATDLHHTRGRAGSLLWDKRFFKALCRGCHDWIPRWPAEARNAGLLCDMGEWNTVPRSPS